MSFQMLLSSDLELRILNEKHANDLFLLIQDNRRFLERWFQWAREVEDVSDSWHFISSSLEKYRTNKAFDAGIWHKNRLVGVVGFHDIFWQYRIVEIGYWLAEKYQGQGMMTQSISALLCYAFLELKLNRVEILCAVHNKKSRAVAERLGFIFEGVHRQAQVLNGAFVDEACYALLAKDFRSHHEAKLARNLCTEESLFRLRPSE